MSGSQALEVAIGLVLMFFLLSLIASSAVEVVSQLLRKRSKDLAKVVGRMIGTPADPAVPTLEGTTAYAMLRLASRQKPSYLPAKAFGDAVMEIVAAARKGADSAGAMFDRLPSGLRARLGPILQKAEGDLTALRAEVETWFDDTMDRLGGSYKRWSRGVLFAVGMGLAVGANASAFGVAAKLWRDPVTRATVSQAAGGFVTESGRPATPTDLKEVAAEVDRLDEVGLPLGWTGPYPAGRGFGVVGTVAGWLATALLVMLGAPFWFDILSRLVSLRSAGKKPERAPDDPGSASSRMLLGGLAPATGPDGVPVPRGVPRGSGGPPLMSPEERLFHALPG